MILQAQLLRAEYMQKAGAVGSSDLYQIYNTLQRMDVPSEDLHHRVALFCDNMYTMSSQNEQLKVIIDYGEEMFFVMSFFSFFSSYSLIYITSLFGYHGYHSPFNVQIRSVRSFDLKLFEAEIHSWFRSVPSLCRTFSSPIRMHSNTVAITSPTQCPECSPSGWTSASRR